VLKSKCGIGRQSVAERARARAAERAASDAQVDSFLASVQCPIETEQDEVSGQAAEVAGASVEEADAPAHEVAPMEVAEEGEGARAAEEEALENEGEAGEDEEMPTGGLEVIEIDEEPLDLDPLRDLSADAMTTSEALAHQRNGEAAWAQCSLSAVRNLLRRESLTADFLAERQLGMARGARDTGTQGVCGDIRFPNWPLILQELQGPDEVVVRFNPQRVGGSELLHDARLMAMVFLSNTHVVAVHRDEESCGGRVNFRKYDNDSDARRRGTFERLPARRLWVGSCEMIAITACGSALHRAAGELRAAGDLRAQRMAELAVVLGSVGLGWLQDPLREAGIRTLASLMSESLESLLSKLTGGDRQRTAAAGVRQKLRGLGLGDAPPLQQLERD